MSRSLSASYLLFIGIIIGIEFAAGALIASVIFYPAKFIGQGVLSHFQSGILMTQVFLRFNIILLIFVALAWAYEAYMYKIGKKDLWTFLLLIGVSVCAYLFVFYFTPYILDIQRQSNESLIKTPEFVKMHKGSEIDMKVLMMLQLGLFFRRFWVLYKH
ncbi:MAG: hypothetical protein CR967_01470 [Proteobacteria bacterium]|nr:MAG: hypothetical protein CR967_01470 [Pseudomonadota bacterium]